MGYRARWTLTDPEPPKVTGTVDGALDGIGSTSMNKATIETAQSLFGEDVVALALTRRSTPSAALARRVAQVAQTATPQSFARWSLSLPWPAFCDVVAICSGAARAALVS